ncbi:MAG: hypothetical protein ACRDEA_12785 [Microcystaceae cyanobacterium]
MFLINFQLILALIILAQEIFKSRLFLVRVQSAIALTKQHYIWCACVSPGDASINYKHYLYGSPRKDA